MSNRRSNPVANLCIAIGLLLTGCQAKPANPAGHSLEHSSYTKLATKTTTQDESQTESATLALLDKRVSLDANDLTLKEVIQFFRQTTQANIFVNWAALKLVKIEPEATVTLKLTDVSASQALRLTLDQVSADAFDDDKAGFAIRDDIIAISTLRDLNATTVLRQYSLDEFVNTRPSVNKRIYARNNEARRMLGMTTLQNKTVDPKTIKVKDLNPGFCANCDAKHDRLEVALIVITYWEKIEQLVELINTTVGDPDQWLDEESTLTVINGTMLVKTTPANHAQIRKLFESLRHQRAQQFKRQALEMETFILLQAAEAARLKQDYKEALKKINQALHVDPNSLEARALKIIVSETLSR